MNKKTPPAKSYQALSTELAQLIEWFESDEVDLDQAVINYEKALKLITQMEKHLQQTKNKVSQLSVPKGN